MLHIVVGRITIFSDQKLSLNMSYLNMNAVMKQVDRDVELCNVKCVTFKDFDARSLKHQPRSPVHSKVVSPHLIISPAVEQRWQVRVRTQEVCL